MKTWIMKLMEKEKDWGSVDDDRNNKLEGRRQKGERMEVGRNTDNLE